VTGKPTALKVLDHFRGKEPQVIATYAAVLEAARSLGPVTEEPKKTSIHLVRDTAFAGVAARRTALVLTLKSPVELKTPRVRRREQVSANRWHLEIRLEAPGDVDTELRRMLRVAYDLAGAEAQS
jgi:hypothetical protein